MVVGTLRCPLHFLALEPPCVVDADLCVNGNQFAEVEERVSLFEKSRRSGEDRFPHPQLTSYRLGPLNEFDLLEKLRPEPRRALAIDGEDICRQDLEVPSSIVAHEASLECRVPVKGHLFRLPPLPVCGKYRAASSP